MIIGIDIDETITDTKSITLKYINQYAPELKGILYEDFSEDAQADFWQKYIGMIQSENEFMPGVKEAFDYLKSEGYEIVIITARGHHIDYDAEGITEALFKKYDVPYDKIIYRTKPKGTVANQMKVKLFIDDREVNLLSAAAYGIQCVRFVERYDETSKFRQFTNWSDLLLYLKMWGRENHGN